MATQNIETQNAEKSASQAANTRRTNSQESVLRPPVDIHETEEGIVLRADMPGVAKERLDLRVDGNTLLIEGTIGIAPQDKMSGLYADVRATTYRRQFVLSNELESGRIEANLQNGVLTVNIPKRAELRPRRIEVRS
jgi:HSP20 family molecular chaperone IbpA